MDAYPYTIHTHEPTRKQLWMASYIASLHHLSPEEAIQAADKALELANERWKHPDWIRTWQYRDNYPVGHEFTFGPTTGDDPGDDVQRR
jgi:hypothetical protein